PHSAHTKLSTHTGGLLDALPSAQHLKSWINMDTSPGKKTTMLSSRQPRSSLLWKETIQIPDLSAQGGSQSDISTITLHHTSQADYAWSASEVRSTTSKSLVR
ncbi:unnamed protein product, partial [Mycena citricolor]